MKESLRVAAVQLEDAEVHVVAEREAGVQGNVQRAAIQGKGRRNPAEFDAVILLGAIQGKVGSAQLDESFCGSGERQVAREFERARAAPRPELASPWMSTLPAIEPLPCKVPLVCTVTVLLVADRDPFTASTPAATVVVPV